ncbi:hypothetical protein LNP02_12620 [Klebsiella variicola subsp. variicola]|nr:hypothetical protein [Klebsiella variicola subsp. variicola]
MLYIDESEFPLVWLTQVEHVDNGLSQSEAYDNSFIQLERILDKKMPFVIISATEFEGEEQHEHSKEEKMKLALWLKKNKISVKKIHNRTNSNSTTEQAKYYIKRFCESIFKVLGISYAHRL